jgi:trimeric autotransporter adhesin
MAYGGLKFDVSLLKCACLQWQQRFAAHQTAAAAAITTAARESSSTTSSEAAASIQSTEPVNAVSSSSTAGVTVTESTSSSSSGTAAIPAVSNAVLRLAGCEPFSYMSAEARATLCDTSTAAAGTQSPWLLLLGRLYSHCGIDSALLAEVLQHVHSSASAAAVTDATTATSDTSSSTTSGSSSSSSTGAAGFVSAAHVRQQQQQQQQKLQPLLREEHANSAGIDFHVSNVLQDVLRAPGIAAAVRRALCMSSSDEAALQDAMRSAMWRFSSGVNVRTPLATVLNSSSSSSTVDTDGADSGGHSEQQLAAAWAVVQEQVQAAALHTIRSRLAS